MTLILPCGTLPYMSADGAGRPRSLRQRWFIPVPWLPLWSVLLANASGCMTVTLYQPQRGIHRPVVVERTPRTFDGVRVLVRCRAHKDFLPTGDATRLCGKLAQDFAAQGAEAEWVVPRGRNFVEEVPFGGEGADLTVEIESRIVHEDSIRLSGVLSGCTCTLLPTVSEHTFSQRVVVMGRDRSVLTEDLLRERFVEYGGCGVWSANLLLDWLVRNDEDKLTGDAPKERFTRDFYGQIRQLTYNARVRAEVLGLLAPTAGAGQGAAPSDEETTVIRRAGSPPPDEAREDSPRSDALPAGADPADADPADADPADLGY